ncbi:MAG TPA: hypothetical protein VKP30_24375 [Polyangiaceae bacterium]|nr:hypothetical protein [Polyangiaceae bacterium]
MPRLTPEGVPRSGATTDQPFNVDRIDSHPGTASALREGGGIATHLGLRLHAECLEFFAIAIEELSNALPKCLTTLLEYRGCVMVSSAPTLDGFTVLVTHPSVKPLSIRTLPNEPLSIRTLPKYRAKVVACVVD